MKRHVLVEFPAGAEEMLSSILDKAVFWQNHSQADINERQRTVLNIFLDR